MSVIELERNKQQQIGVIEYKTAADSLIFLRDPFFSIVFFPEVIFKGYIFEGLYSFLFHFFLQNIVKKFKAVSGLRLFCIFIKYGFLFVMAGFRGIKIKKKKCSQIFRIRLHSIQCLWGHYISPKMTNYLYYAVDNDIIGHTKREVIFVSGPMEHKAGKWE